MIILLFVLIGIGVAVTCDTTNATEYHFQPKLYTRAVHRVKGYLELHEEGKEAAVTAMEAKINSVVSVYDADNQKIMMQYRLVDLITNDRYGSEVDPNRYKEVFSLEKGFDGSIIANSLMNVIQNTSSLVTLVNKVPLGTIFNLLMVRLYSAVTTGHIVFPSYPLALNQSWSPPSFELSFVNDFIDGNVNLKVDRTFTLKNSFEITGTTTIIVVSNMPSRRSAHGKQDLIITINHEWTLDSSTIVTESKHSMKGTFTDYIEDGKVEKVELVGECITKLLSLSEVSEDATKVVENVSSFLIDKVAEIKEAVETEAEAEAAEAADDDETETETKKAVADPEVPMLESSTWHYWSDTSCDCPHPDLVYAQVFVSGYQVIMYYNGTTYDIRTMDNSMMICPQGQSKDRRIREREENRVASESRKEEVSDKVVEYLQKNSTNFSWQASVVRIDEVWYSDSPPTCLSLRSDDVLPSYDNYRMIIKGNGVVYDLRISNKGNKILMCPWTTMTFASEPIIY
jgi:hypothetical protein